jgi:hypothetical protein
MPTEIVAAAPGAPVAAPPARAPSVTPVTIAPAAKPAAPVAIADVNVDAEDIGKWGKLQRQARELKSKLTAADARAAEFEKELGALRPAADKGSAVEKLVKEGKLTEAMKVAGLEAEAAFAQWVEDSEGKPAAAGPPKELLDLQARVDALDALKKAEDDAKKAADAEQLTVAQQAQRAEVVKGLTDKITADGARWARCGKEPGEAAEDAIGVAREKAKLLGRAVTDAEAEELLDKALDAVEAGYKALAEKFYIPEAPKPRFGARPATVAKGKDDVLARESSPVVERKVAVTLDGQRGSLRAPATETKGKLSEAEAKAKALASIRAMRRG